MKRSTIGDFDRILKLNGTCNISPETTELRISMTLKVMIHTRTFKGEGERNDHMPRYEQVFRNVSERRESKCCAVLMKYCRKVKGEPVMTL